MGAEITFKRPDGGDAKGYLTNAARGDAPGVVVIQEWWGLAEQIKALVDRFALAGFDALAPDLFNGVVVPYHDAERASKEMMSLNFLDATEQTVRGAVQYLKRNGARSASPVFAWGARSRSSALQKSRSSPRRYLFTGCPRSRPRKPLTLGFRSKVTSPIRTTTSRPRPAMLSRRR
jgi:carboxymethylenebutenolidase